MKRRSMLAAMGAVGAPGLALAAGYPERPVKILMPYPPGGSFDGPARLIAAKLTKLSGSPVLVENRGGANGVIAAQEVINSAPDGYTLFISSNALSIAATMQRRAPYSPLKDFRHVAVFAVSRSVLVANPQNVRFGLRELILASKAAPGKYTYASAGTGSSAHLQIELLKQRFGVDWMHVPYKGSGPALQDVIGGVCDIALVGVSAALAHIRSGVLKPLGFTQRTPALQRPDVPTFADIAPGPEIESWLGLAAPAKTTDLVIDRLTALLIQAFGEKDLLLQLTELGLDPRLADAEGATARVAKDIQLYSQLSRTTGIVLE